MYIKVKAVQGRVVRTSPNGEFIPDDRFISVQLTPYVERLLNVHKDVIQEAATAPLAKVAPTTTTLMKPSAKAENKEDS